MTPIMNDRAYHDALAQVGACDAAALDELEAEAARRGDRATLLRIELRRGPSEEAARAAGDRLGVARAIIGRAALWKDWDRLVGELSRWPDTPATRADAAALAALLDEIGEDDQLREAPARWWNPGQTGTAPVAPVPVGWPLVRRLKFMERRPPLVPCTRPELLAALTEIDADEMSIPPAMLAAATRVRRLTYVVRSPALPPLPETVEELALTLHRPVDLGLGLAHLPRVRVLKLAIEGEAPDLAPLAGMSVHALHIYARTPLGSLVVPPTVRVLSVDGVARIDDLPALEDLFLARYAALPALPHSLRKLHLAHGPLDQAALAPLAALAELLLTDVRVRALDLTGLPSLREVRAGDCVELERIDVPPGCALSIDR